MTQFLKPFYTATCILLLSVGTLVAQSVDPIATIETNGKGKAILFHDFTGVPIIKTNTTFAGMNPQTHEIMWEVERAEMSALGETGGESAGDYYDFYDTPFVYLNGTVINALSGQVLIDGPAEEIKRFGTYYLLPDQDLFLIEVGAKGMIKLFAINPINSTLEWSVDLREMSGLSQMVNAESSGPKIIPPSLTAAGDLLYHNAKNLALIDLDEGKLLWNNKVNPGYIFTNDDATRLVVAEARGGLGSAMNFTGITKYGKSIHLLDAATGESLWSKGSEKMDGNVQFIMPYDGGFLVVHDEGMNIYDYTPGNRAEGRWKKDYSEKNITNLVEEEDGLMVYFKNKRMLVDPATGEELWKREERLEKEPPVYVMARRSNEQTVGEAAIYTRGNNVYVKIGNRERVQRFDVYIVDEENQRLVLARDPYPEATTIGRQPYTVVAIDLNTGESSRIRIQLKRAAPNIDATENGYFIYNDRGFVLLDFDGEEWTETEEEFYVDPAGADRAIARLGLMVAGAAVSTRSTSNYVLSNDAGSSQRYRDRMNASDEVSNAGWDMTERKINGRVEADFAYFFARNDDRQLVLFKIDKNTGQEVKQFPFDDQTPVYEIDEPNNQLYYLVDSTLKIFSLD